MDSPSSRIEQLEKQLSAAQAEIARLQRDSKAAEGAEPPVGISEFEDTLKRLVQRVAMILQAEKCVIMIRDKDSGDLMGRSPAFNMSEEDIRSLRVPQDSGVAGEVYRSGKPAVFHDATTDPRTHKDIIGKLKIKNGVVVPLVVERRDDDNRILDRLNIGVMNVFNKRYGDEFNEEDVRLLERLARNAAAVIANAQMFQEIVEEKQKLVHTIESLYAGLVMISGNGRILQMNARAREIFNVQIDPVGKPYKDTIDHEKAQTIFAKLMDTETARNETGGEESKAAEEINVSDPETEEDRIYQVHAAPVFGEDGHLIGNVFIMNDVTDIRNLERMKTEFVAIAAHELRTPMTPIKGFISMLADDEFDTFGFEERKEYYQIINTNVDRLGRLINDLLNVTRIEKGVKIQLFWEEVNLCTLSESVFEIQRGMTNTSKHLLAIDAVPNPLFATVGKDQMEQILQNLVSNAIKYSPEGGPVTIIMRDEPETGTVLMGVKDSGTGIPESARSKLFKPYRRIHNAKTASVKGTGIGLFLVKELVEAHGGTIWVESEMDVGTTFWFRIPKLPTEDEASADNR